MLHQVYDKPELIDKHATSDWVPTVCQDRKERRKLQCGSWMGPIGSIPAPRKYLKRSCDLPCLWTGHDILPSFALSHLPDEAHGTIECHDLSRGFLVKGLDLVELSLESIFFVHV